MTGEEIKAAAVGKTDSEAWDDVIAAVKAEVISPLGRIGIMKKVAVWGAVVYDRAQKGAMSAVTETLAKLKAEEGGQIQ